MTSSPIVHVVGARPNFMKAAPVISALEREGLPQLCIHTGQHYDAAMSDVFFTELGLPEPDLNLGIGSGSHASQTAALLSALEPALLDASPSMVVVYGDVNSTLAAALVAAKLHMPVEINRRVADSLSEMLFVTSPEGIANLADEGIAASRIHFVGNPMIDTLLANLGRFDPDRIRPSHGFDDLYGVVTLHRPANVDDAAMVRQIVAALMDASRTLPLVFPVHPRGRLALEAAGLQNGPGLLVMDPLGYVDFLSLVRGASAVITDSGGIQEETTVLGIPCLTLRPNTERPITITHGTNQLITVTELVPRLEKALARSHGEDQSIPPLWDGRAGSRIARLVADAPSVQR